jgi:glycosyltransferase involved in cell wall biosynthesis
MLNGDVDLMLIKVLMITHNRPEYVRLSLERLCSSAPVNLKVTIWDNGSGPETRDIVRKYEGHQSVEQVVYNETNELLRPPTNWFWQKNPGADLLGKVDDDCLVPENWIDILAEAHSEIQQAGILGCWHFLPQDMMRQLAEKKIHTFGRHQIMRNCWVGGSGYLMKRTVLDKNGIIRPKETFTDFCIRASASGFVNGWYFPFLYQDHMDDPRSPHTAIRSEEDFQRMIPLSARTFGIKTREQWIQRLMTSARRLQEYSIDPYDYIGFRAQVTKRISQILRREYFPKVK